MTGPKTVGPATRKRSRVKTAKPETFAPFDAADFLRDEKEIAAFMDVAAQDGDPDEIARALGTIARAQSMTNVARDAGLGPK